MYNMLDVEIDIQGEIREYYERVQRRRKRMVAQAHLQEILNIDKGNLRREVELTWERSPT